MMILILWFPFIFLLVKAILGCRDFIRIKRAFITAYRPESPVENLIAAIRFRIKNKDFVLDEARQMEVKEIDVSIEKYTALIDAKVKEGQGVLSEIKQIQDTPDVSRNNDGQISRRSYRGQELLAEIEKKKEIIEKYNRELYVWEVENERSRNRKASIMEQPHTDWLKYSSSRKKVLIYCAILAFTGILLQSLVPIQNTANYLNQWPGILESSNTEGQEDRDYSVAVGALVLRTEPNRNSKPLGNLSRGTKVSIVTLLKETESIDGITGSWALIRLKDGRSGYVFTGYLRPLQ